MVAPAVREALSFGMKTCHVQFFVFKRTSDLVLEGIILNFPQTISTLARTLGNKGPRTLGVVLWFAHWLFTGGSVRLCCRANCGLDAVYDGPDVLV